MDCSPAIGITESKTIETSWTCNDRFADLYSHMHPADVEKPLHDLLFLPCKRPALVKHAGSDTSVDVDIYVLLKS